MSRKPDTNSVNYIIIILIAAATALITTLASAKISGGGAVSEAELEGAVGKYIVGNPLIIANAMREAYEIQQKQEEDAAKENVSKLKNDLESDAGTPIAGNAEGDVTIVEFFDYNCGFCKRMLPDINAVLEEDKNVKVAFKAIGILGDLSVVAAKSAVAAYAIDKDKFWEFHQTLLTSGARSEEAIDEAAKAAGYDVKKLREKMASAEIAAQVEKHSALANEIGVRGTPAYVIGSTVIRGAQGKDALMDAVRATRGE